MTFLRFLPLQPSRQPVSRNRKKASWYIGASIFPGKKRGAPGYATFCFRQGVCFRLSHRARAVRHSAGWACPTAFLFSDALIDIRIGRTTNNAIATTMKFMIAATANTACQSPV